MCLVNSSSIQNGYFTIPKFFAYKAYYSIRTSKAALETERIMQNPLLSHLRGITNFGRTKMMKYLINKKVRPLACNQKFCIERAYESIDASSIHSPEKMKLRANIDPMKVILLNEFIKDNQKVNIWLLHTLKFKINNPTIETPIIIYFRGGGFVMESGMGTIIMMSNICEKTGFPIFSVEYRVAPEDPFPASIDDGIQAFNWIKEYSVRIFGIKPTKIIIMGDSAGANIAFATTLACIRKKMALPDSLFLIYPRKF